MNIKNEIFNQINILLRDDLHQYTDLTDMFYSKALRELSKEELLSSLGIQDIKTKDTIIPLLIGSDMNNKFIASNEPIVIDITKQDTLPFRDITQIYYVQDNRNILKLYKTQPQYNTLVKTRPYSYSIFGNKLIFNPELDQTYTFRFFYKDSIIKENQDNRDAIMFLTLFYILSIGLNDTEEAQKYYVLYQTELNKLKEIKSRELKTGQLLPDIY